MAKVIKQGTTSVDTLTAGSTAGGNAVNDTFVIYGYAGNDVITGGDNYDQLYGGMGNDSLSGGAGGDRLYGEAGQDTLQGGAGNDTLDGGANAGGYDYATYKDGTAAINFDMATNTYGTSTGASFDASAAGLGTDTLKNIEGVIGTQYADTITGDANGNYLFGDDPNITSTTGEDSIYGGAGGDQIYGHTGDDFLRGDAGADYLSGGDGVDTLDYSTATSTDSSGIVLLMNDEVLVGDGIVTAGNTDVGADTFGTIEKVIGTNYNDTITGGMGHNSLDGGAGDDSLVGGGGLGNDTLMGGDGNDAITVNTGGSFTVDGGVGNDTLNISISKTSLASVSAVEVINYNSFTTGIDTVTIDFGGVEYRSIGVTSIDVSGFTTADKIQVAKGDGKFSATTTHNTASGIGQYANTSTNVDLVKWNNTNHTAIIKSQSSTGVGAGYSIQITGLPNGVTAANFAFV